MNRIILIGNGFDLAHGLKTRYNDFIDDYWDRKTELFIESYKAGKLIFHGRSNHPIGDYKDNDITVTNLQFFQNLQTNDEPGKKGYEKFHYLSMRIPATQERTLVFNNAFLEQLTKKRYYPYWVDIEEEYYLALKNCLEGKSKGNIAQLNKEFSALQTALENYLKTQTASQNDRILKVKQKIYSDLSKEEEQGTGFECKNKILYLNFNYTETERLYTKDASTENVVHIHGELGKPSNSIIFGYGDELDDKYKHIEQKNDNDYLRNIKSMRYSETRNYKELETFINSGKYQIFIMGHSCGVSDKTLLNKLFEHPNCVSIKIFYHDRGDGTDNYFDLYCNISRNFINKNLQRERVINKMDSEPLT